MTPLAIAALGIAGLLVLIALRMPVGLAMFVAGAIGFVTLSSPQALIAFLKTGPYFQFANYTLSVIPLFVLMGALAEQSGLSRQIFRAAAALIGHMRGGLAMATILACTAFGAICGSSVATTATFGRAALPELERYRYDGGFATGTIAVGGTLGILIPPSIILVIYAIETEQNIAKLFMAALIPGLLAATFYCIAIALMVRFRPDYGPPHEPEAGTSTLSLIVAVWPVLVLAGIVVVGIYGGVFTPTEGAAVGAVFMLLIGVMQGQIGMGEFIESFRQTAQTTGMIFLILLGSEMFNAFLALSRLPQEAATVAAGLDWSPYAVMILLMAIYILLGALMDELAILLLTLPVFFPVVQALDFGLGPDETAIWFGILLLITVGIGLTSPPIGLNVFVIGAMAKNVPITATYRGVLPFIAMDIVRLGLVLAFPGLALWLVRLLT